MEANKFTTDQHRESGLFSVKEKQSQGHRPAVNVIHQLKHGFEYNDIVFSLDCVALLL